LKIFMLFMIGGFLIKRIVKKICSLEFYQNTILKLIEKVSEQEKVRFQLANNEQNRCKRNRKILSGKISPRKLRRMKLKADKDRNSTSRLVLAKSLNEKVSLLVIKLLIRIDNYSKRETSKIEAIKKTVTTKINRVTESISSKKDATIEFIVDDIPEFIESVPERVKETKNNFRSFRKRSVTFMVSMITKFNNLHRVPKIAFSIMSFLILYSIPGVAQATGVESNSMSIWTLMIICSSYFVFAYIIIASEHSKWNQIDKAATAAFMGITMWILLSIFGPSIDITSIPKETFAFWDDVQSKSFSDAFQHAMEHHGRATLFLVFFLLVAITTVETIDINGGFDVLKSMIKTTNKKKLMWIIVIIVFFASAFLDNLTTSIAFYKLVKKFFPERGERMPFTYAVIYAANGGGIWFVTGDLTTTQLWLGTQLTPMTVVFWLIAPSAVAVAISTYFLSRKVSGTVKEVEVESHSPLEEVKDLLESVSNDLGELNQASKNKVDLALNFLRQVKEKIGDHEPIHLKIWERKAVFIVGILAFVAVPIIKKVFHVEPWMAITASFSVVFLFTEILHRGKPDYFQYSVLNAFRKVDGSTIFFFVGLLMAVTLMESIGALHVLGGSLEFTAKELLAVADIASITYVYDLIGYLIGMISAVVDNVAMVAAGQGMYSITDPDILQNLSGEELERAMLFVQDGRFWLELCYGAGFGGNLIIFGSAAGVALMGLDHIEFMEYLKATFLLGFLGYTGGYITLLVEFAIFM